MYGSNLEADGAHQLEAIALGHYAFTQFVVELHPPVLQMILEVHVAHDGLPQPRERGQRQIVGGREPDGALPGEGAQNALGTDAPIVGIRALEHLIDEKEERRLPSGEILELANRVISA